MTVIYNMSIDRADKPWIGDRRFTESTEEFSLALVSSRAKQRKALRICCAES